MDDEDEMSAEEFDRRLDAGDPVTISTSHGRPNVRISGVLGSVVTISQGVAIASPSQRTQVVASQGGLAPVA